VAVDTTKDVHKTTSEPHKDVRIVVESSGPPTLSPYGSTMTEKIDEDIMFYNINYIYIINQYFFIISEK
jgi:hypothetical protein